MTSSPIHTIFWDLKDTLIYPSSHESTHPAKNMGFDMVLVDWLMRHQDMQHVVVSNYTSKSAHDMIQQAGLSSYFCYISGADEASQRKPHTSQYDNMPSFINPIIQILTIPLQPFSTP